MIDKEAEWRRIIEDIKSCRRCRLYKSRKNPVPGEGSLNPRIMFIGEAPGGREDETGRPFVGAAGRLLTNLIESIGLDRLKDTFITNVIKCRPPQNRDPTDEEIEACLPFLKRQLILIKPRLIVTLGRHAAKTIFKLAGSKFRSMTSEHGKIFEGLLILGFKTTVIPTYHPAAALYNPALKESLFGDFKLIGRYLKGEAREAGPLERFIR